MEAPVEWALAFNWWILFQDEDEGPPPETRIEAEIPKINTDLGRDLHFVKLPNFLSIETRPFDPELYEDEIDDEETLDEEGRARWVNIDWPTTK